MQMLEDTDPSVIGYAPQRSMTDWAMWSVLPAITLLCTAANQGKVLTILFSPLALIVGFYFIRRSAADYVRFTVAIYAFTSLVRRLADWTSAYTPGSPVNLAPYLVICLAAMTLFRPSRASAKQMLPFILAGIGVAYGLLVGILSLHDPALYKSGMGWLSPLLFGLFCMRERNKIELRDSFLQAGLWCGVFTAAYGIVQYIFAPAWDAKWLSDLQATGGGSSFGLPVPFGIRVFSTAADPGTCAYLCSLGLVCTLRVKSSLKYLLMLICIVALVSTMIRTVWVSSVLVLILVLWKMPKKESLRFAVVAPSVLIIAGLLILPFLDTKQSTALTERFSSFNSIKNDASYRARTLGISMAINLVSDEPFGKGIGFLDSQVYWHSPFTTIANVGGPDIGALEIPIELGYLGCICYVSAMVMATIRFVRVFIFSPSADDAMVAAFGLSAWFLFVSTNPMVIFEGSLFWMALGLLTRNPEQELTTEVRLGTSKEVTIDSPSSTSYIFRPSYKAES